MARRKRETRKPPTKDRATAYARDVIAGKIIAGRPVRLACERHIRDLKRKDLRWCPDEAELAIEFFAQMLVLEDGSPFLLADFQCFIVGAIFGWYNADGARRFRVAYIETGKGSGKTPMAAGVGLKGMIADDEPAPEIYSAATTADQASIAWKDARRMVEMSPELNQLVLSQLASLSIPSQHAVFRPVSAEHRGLDGKRPHIGIIDEFHEHPTNVVLEKIRAGTKRRRNALIFVITNSGFDRASPCWQRHQYALEVLEGLKVDDAQFAYVCSLDLCEKCRAAGSKAANCEACDDWRDEKVWPKANPGLGTILPVQYLREQVQEAKGMPSKENIVRRLNFCEWTEQFQRWLDMAAWDECGLKRFEPADIKALRCIAGLDMASRSDFAAWVKLFGPDEDGVFSVIARFWLPEASLEAATSKRTEGDRLMLRQWVDAGFIELTPGSETDYDTIESAVLADVEGFGIREIVYDRYDATQLSQHLRDKLGEDRVIAFSQAMSSMSAPSKELESLVRGGSLQHNANPVLRWMASNTTIRHGPDGMIKPDKDRSPEKIDGIIALIEAIGRATIRTADAPPWDGEVMVLS